MAHPRSEVVSDDNEQLILVDSQDQPVGELDKGACHDGDGILHRAFSLFIFNSQGDLLLQQRAASKRLWPNFWANSCCSHPRAGEDLAIATQRRCAEELGFTTPLQYVYKFEYQAKFGNLGSEHELCSVFIGHYTGATNVNQTEIQSIRWIRPDDLDTALTQQGDQFTPWLHLEWQTLRRDYADLLPA
ncbi:MAG: isopentenyl-diphosphate Delta-isomerase [Pseudomonadota bacterium]